MRKTREALRLRGDGFSGRRVAQSLSIGRATISEYFRRADLEGLSWPLPTDLSDVDIERRLFPNSPGEARLAVPGEASFVHPVDCQQPNGFALHAEVMETMEQKHIS